MRISDWSSDVCSSDLAYPDNRGKVVFLQINPPSRSDVADYVDIRRELEAVAGHVNGAFAKYDWAPIRYLNKSFSRRALAGFFRAARVGLVTPLRDGMNLVAKDFVAAQSARQSDVEGKSVSVRVDIGGRPSL